MKRVSIRVVWTKLEIKQEVILYLGTYPLPQSDLIFRNGGSIQNTNKISNSLKIIDICEIYICMYSDTLWSVEYIRRIIDRTKLNLKYN